MKFFNVSKVSKTQSLRVSESQTINCNLVEQSAKATIYRRVCRRISSLSFSSEGDGIFSIPTKTCHLGHPLNKEANSRRGKTLSKGPWELGPLPIGESPSSSHPHDYIPAKHVQSQSLDISFQSDDLYAGPSAVSPSSPGQLHQRHKSDQSSAPEASKMEQWERTQSQPSDSTILSTPPLQRSGQGISTLIRYMACSL